MQPHEPAAEITTLTTTDKTKVALAAIGCITLLEGIALATGIDGFALSGAIAAIGSIGGAFLGVRWLTTQPRNP